MNRLQAEHLCHLCKLGRLLAEPQVVTGGLLHSMWRFTTTQGSFAVKQLNMAIVSTADIRESYNISEQIAAEMLQQGIPAVAALVSEQGILQEVDDKVFLLYPWVDGETLSAGPVEAECARLIGATLGRMHSLRLHHAELTSLTWKHFEDEDWDMLTFQAADLGLAWAYPVRAMLPRLLDWSRCYEQACTALSQTLVISHRDLDQKNVLWHDAHTPKIIDWEAAGLINPTMELVGVALNWSGQRVGEPREDIFVAVMEGYIQAGGVVRDSGSDALYGFIGTWLGWLLFNMRRSLGESIASEEERQIGVREVANTLALLRASVAHLETWAMWVDRLR